MNTSEKAIRKSPFRRYYMIAQNAAPALVYLGVNAPYALKILLYMMNHMDQLNQLNNTAYKQIQDAYSFVVDSNELLKIKSIASSTLSKNMKILKDLQIIDIDYELYNKYRDEHKKVSVLPRTIHTYVLNPRLVWNSYFSKRTACKFPMDYTFLNLLKSPDPKKKLQAQYLKSSEIDSTSTEQPYYMINKKYENDFYWIAQQNMNSITIFFYLLLHMNYLNEILHRDTGGVNGIADYLGIRRQTASKAISLLRKHNFVYIQKSGQYNTYILNPELVWSSEKANFTKCNFPANLSVNTPYRIQRPVSEAVSEINYSALAKMIYEYAEQTIPSMAEQTLAEKLKTRKQISNEIQQLYNDFQSPVIPELFHKLLSSEQRKELHNE